MKKATVLFALIEIGLSSIAQEGVKISSDVSPPHPSAMFEVASSNKGALFPRVQLDDVTDNQLPVLNPTEALMIYNETGSEPKGFYYFDGTKWMKFGTGNKVPVMSYTAMESLIPNLTIDDLGMFVYVDDGCWSTTNTSPYSNDGDCIPLTGLYYLTYYVDGQGLPGEQYLLNGVAQSFVFYKMNGFDPRGVDRVEAP